MSITATTSRVDYSSNGTATAFPFTFKILADTDIVVTTRSLDTGAEATLTEGTHYSVSGVGNDAGGTVTLVAASVPPSGDIVTIRRVRPLTQQTDIRNQGRYAPELHEDAFDHQVMLAQQLQEQMARAVKVGTTYPEAPTLPMPEAGKAITWGEDGSLVNKFVDSTAIALPGDGRTVPTVGAYLDHNKRFNVKDYGATGDGSTDDTDAIRLAISECFPSSNNVGIGVLYFPAGTYKVTERLTIGYTGARYNNVTVIGDGRGASTIRWFGGTTDGPLEFLNCNMAFTHGLSIKGGDSTTNLMAFGLWYNVEDGESGIAPRTDNVYIANADICLKIGGGELLSSGQMNAGLHTQVFCEAMNTAIAVYGANTECQYFVGLNFGKGLSEGGEICQSFNGRGMYFSNVEGTNKGGDTTFLHAQGGSFGQGGGFVFRNMRIEQMWRLAYLEAGSDTTSHTPINVTVDQVECASLGLGTPTDPCDVIEFRYVGTISVRNSIFRQANSRILCSGQTTSARDNVAVTIENCQFNNANAVTDPTALCASTPDGTGTGSGIWLDVRGCHQLDATNATTIVARIPNSITHRTPANVAGSTYSNPITIETDGVTVSKLTVGSTELTPTAITDLTDGGDTTLHGHSLASISGGTATGSGYTLPDLTIAGAFTVSGALSAASSTITGNVSAAKAIIGKATSTQGGKVQYKDDGGTIRWQVGLLAAGGDRNLVIYDMANSASRLTVDAATGDVTVAGKFVPATVFQHSGTTAGFYGVTPVTRASAITAPTGGTTVDAEARTAIAALITALQNIGITL